MAAVVVMTPTIQMVASEIFLGFEVNALCAQHVNVVEIISRKPSDDWFSLIEKLRNRHAETLSQASCVQHRIACMDKITFLL